MSLSTDLSQRSTEIRDVGTYRLRLGHSDRMVSRWWDGTRWLDGKNGEPMYVSDDEDATAKLLATPW